MDVLDQKYISSLSDPALWISVFALYVAERHASQQQSLHLLPGMRITPDPWSISSTEDIRAHGHGEDTVDTILGYFEQYAIQQRRHSPVFSTVTKFSLVLRLLRFVQYRLLYVSSGWMAQHQEVDAAAQHIARLLHAEPRRARQALLYAAQLFRIIRSQSQFDPYDSFILLMAVLYIRSYDKFVISDTLQYPSDAVAEEIFRVDQTLNEDLQKRWLEGTFKPRKQLHISGVGVLNGQDSISRTLRESMRILNHDRAWSCQANAIKHSLHQMILGGAPSFPTEAG